MKFWRRILPYLILNVVISAATTLLVITLWDRSQTDALPISTGGIPASGSLQTAAPTDNSGPQTTPTMPPLDTPVIEIEAVIGAGDLETETVVLKRVGEGELLLTGWKLSNGRGSEFTFPDLVLNKNGSVRLYTRSGANSVIELYWSLTESVWRSRDTATLIDMQGNLRANYILP